MALVGRMMSELMKGRNSKRDASHVGDDAQLILPRESKHFANRERQGSREYECSRVYLGLINTLAGPPNWNQGTLSHFSGS